MTVIVAHRGWSGAAPENTMAAFELALKEPAIDYIELDVHLSADGVPVVIHDHTLNRTTSGQGPVREASHAELARLDAGSWYAPEFAGERIPTLAEVLELCKGRMRLAVELKTMGELNRGLEEKVVSLIQQYGMQDEVVLSSFDHDSMKLAHELDPSITTGLILLGKPTLLLEQLAFTGATSLSIHYGFATPELLAQMAEAGIDIGVWTVDDPEQLAQLVARYPDLRITTNYPDRLLAAIGAQAAIAR